MVMSSCYGGISYYRFLYEPNFVLQYNQCTQCNQCIPFLTCLYAFISTMFLLCIFFFISLYYDDLSYSVSHVVYELGNEVKIEGKLTVLL